MHTDSRTVFFPFFFHSFSQFVSLNNRCENSISLPFFTHSVTYTYIYRILQISYQISYAVNQGGASETRARSRIKVSIESLINDMAINDVYDIIHNAY